MVIFDLICQNDHRFEGWFADLADLDVQLTGGLISCPVCGDTHIQRRPSTFGMVKSRQGDDAPKGKRELLEEKKQDLYRQLAEASDRLREDFADVGPSFSDEALKMHYGASPRRNIMGHSTGAEEELLRKEGVEFYKAPLLVRKPSSAN
jgi:hypothetical protein